MFICLSALEEHTQTSGQIRPFQRCPKWRTGTDAPLIGQSRYPSKQALNLSRNRDEQLLEASY